MTEQRDALRVVIETERDATFPAEWGWDEDETAAYMARVESGEIEVLWLHVESRCACCGTWKDHDETGDILPALGDVHVLADDIGISGAIYETNIPAGPYYPRDLIERVGADALDAYALPCTASENYLIQTAADLMCEARPVEPSAAQAV